jgi:hypothetical protein
MFANGSIVVVDDGLMSLRTRSLTTLLLVFIESIRNVIFALSFISFFLYMAFDYKMKIQ